MDVTFDYSVFYMQYISIRHLQEGHWEGPVVTNRLGYVDGFCISRTLGFVDGLFKEAQ